MPNRYRGKWKANSIEGAFIGYTANGYKIFIPELNKIIESRNVAFNHGEIHKLILMIEVKQEMIKIPDEPDDQENLKLSTCRYWMGSG